MSWSTNFQNPVAKADAVAALNELGIPGAHDGAAVDQLSTAKTAAKILLQNVPGPYVLITMSGHANGVGWHKKEGFANDCISVNVTQMTEDDLKYYK